MRRPEISDDYIIYLQEHGYDVDDVSYLTNYKEAISSNGMKDEMTFMLQNKV